MKKLLRIAGVTILIGIITAWAITIPVFSEIKISMVGRWNFDSNILDSSGNGNHGSHYPYIPPFVEGVHQYGINFTGSNYVEIPNSSSLNFGTGDYSISGWVKTTSTKTINTIIDKRVSGNCPGYHVALYKGTLLFQVGDSTSGGNFYDSSYSKLLNDGALHFFVITVDQYYTLDIKFYIDGVFHKSFSTSSYRGSSSNNAPLYIGKHSSDSNSNFVGVLDEIALYSSTLNSGEITQLYLNGSCNGRWALDGDAVDVSGNGNNGTLFGSPIPETVYGLYYLNQALRFNGSNHINVPDSPTLDFGAGDFSLSFWVNTTNTNSYNTIIDKRETAGYHVVLYFGRVLLQIATASNWANFYSSTSAKLNDGYWHFVTITVDRDNSSGIKFYVDNTLANTFNPTPYQGDISNSAPLYIGKHKDYATDNFQGMLDEVKMYKRVISTGEINLQYLMGSSWKPATYNTYYGHIHNHSELSDCGTGAPANAYSYAKTNGKLDFFGLADHAEDLTDSDWETLKAAARAANVDGAFVTFCGFEWSSTDNYGHVAVINTPDNVPHYISSSDTDYDTFPELVNWLSSQNAIAFFNHPGRENEANREFSHFAINPSDKFVGMELWNKAVGFSTYYYNTGYYTGDNFGYFDEALARKWKIGAAGSEDNHTSDWGNRYPYYRLAVLATAKTQAAILDALKARRFYSTLDRNLKLSFTINSAPMGASISPGTHYVLIYASDDDSSESFTKIELLKNGVVINTWTSFGSATKPYVGLNLTVSNGEYYYVRVTEADGSQAISSPIFINY
jgi:hypothetical protein